MNRIRIFIFFISLCFAARSQTKICPEEMAFKHLIRLMQADSSYKKLRFFAKGKIYDYQMSDLDTIFCRATGGAIIANNPFGENVSLNENRIKKFKVPAEFKNHNEYKPIRIFQYFKSGNKYYVLMNIQDSDLSGYNVVMILNSKGDLLKECLFSWTA